MRKGLIIFLTIILFPLLLITGISSWVIVGEKNYVAGQHSVNNAVAYILDNPSVKYTRIEKALSVAESGDIVIVIPPSLPNYHDVNNKNTPDQVTYHITSDCEIKEGVTLVIPTDKNTLNEVTNASSLNTYITSMYTDDRTKSRGTTTSYASIANESLYLRVTVEVSDNITLINNGTLVISGYLSGGSSNAGSMGHISHSYSRILLGENSRITQNNSEAITYCLGYIEEKTKDSYIDINKGKLYIPFVVSDYRGFSFSWSMTAGAINDQRCSPFNQITINNIYSNVYVNFNAKVYVFANVYVYYKSDVQNVDDTFTKILSLIGNDNSFLIQLTDSKYSSVSYKYDKSTKKSKLVIFGGSNLNQFQLSLSKSGVTVDLSTANAFFPISYQFEIELKSVKGQSLAVFDVSKQRIKLLTGSTFSVGENCKLIGQELVVYTSFYDGTLGNGYSSYNSYESVKYPLKPGAVFKILGNGQVQMNKLAGTVYGNKDNISCSSDVIISKEAWSYALRGGLNLNPAWATNEFLELREKLNILDLSYSSDKIDKLYIGLNTFTNYNSFIPSVNVILNDSSHIFEVSQYQTVIHFSDIKNYKFDFVNNIYKLYSNSNYYEKNSVIVYNENTAMTCAINSVDSISNNKNGINEFNVQNIKVTCTTPLYQGKIPLYIGKTVSLNAEVTDINKVYNKKITWYSSDESVAKVDMNTGNVTGVSLGKVTISAVCDGVVGTIDLEVIEEIEIINVQEIYISDEDGNTSKNKDATYHGSATDGSKKKYTINIVPSDAAYASIKWTLNKTASNRQWINDDKVSSETVSTSTSITVNFADAGINPDYPSIKCEVIDLNGNKHETIFKIEQKQGSSGGCLLPGTMITMSDGTTKPVEQVQPGDMLKVFNHYTGEYDVSPVVFNDSEPKTNVNVINLEFSNGSNIGVVYEHGFFDLDLMKYVYIDEYNYNDYVGHRFYSDGNNIVTLNRAYITTEYTEVYSPVTAYHLNYFTEDILSMPGGIEGLFNIFEYDDDLKYNEELMKQDIETYGLYTYDDFKDYCSYEFYQAFPAEYLKVSVGKGYITFDEIIYLINRYKTKV